MITWRFSGGSGYGQNVLGESDLAEAALAAFTALVKRMADDASESSMLAEELGRRRAQQGIELESLLSAIRLDFGILWKMLRRLAEPGDVNVLLDNAQQVHDAVEAHVAAVQRAYLTEEARLRSDRQWFESQIIARFLDDTHTSGLTEADVARALRVDAGASYTVIALPEEADQAEIAKLQQVQGVRVHRNSDETILIKQGGGSDWIPGRLSLYGGIVADVPGLAAVPAAALSARKLATVARPGEGLTDAESGWVRICREALVESLPQIISSNESRLEEFDAAERERVLQTVEVFARLGSVKLTAAALFCHRNTVVNRLKSFEERTNLDLTIPAQAAFALVAISDQLGADCANVD